MFHQTIKKQSHTMKEKIKQLKQQAILNLTNDLKKVSQSGTANTQADRLHTYIVSAQIVNL